MSSDTPALLLLRVYISLLASVDGPTSTHQSYLDTVDLYRISDGVIIKTS